MKIIKTTGIFLLVSLGSIMGFSSGTMQARDYVYEHVENLSKNFDEVLQECEAISFSHPYPLSILKKIKFLAMRLWNETYGMQKTDQYGHVTVKFEQCAYATLDLNVMCDLLLFPVVSDEPGYRHLLPGMDTVHFCEEISHLLDLVRAIEKNFDVVLHKRAVGNYEFEYKITVHVVLGYLRKKIEKFLELQA